MVLSRETDRLSSWWIRNPANLEEVDGRGEDLVEYFHLVEQHHTECVEAVLVFLQLNQIYSEDNK